MAPWFPGHAGIPLLTVLATIELSMIFLLPSRMLSCREWRPSVPVNMALQLGERMAASWFGVRTVVLLYFRWAAPHSSIIFSGEVKQINVEGEVKDIWGTIHAFAALLEDGVHLGWFR